MGAGGIRKATSGIMGPWPVKAHSKAICVGLRFLADSDRQIDPARWCVAVGSPPPGRAAAAKGTGVHWLKGDASWVQNVVTACEALPKDIAFC
jgi:hypothetical protein